MGLMEAKQRRQNLLFSATWPSAVHTLAGVFFCCGFLGRFWRGAENVSGRFGRILIYVIYPCLKFFIIVYLSILDDSTVSVCCDELQDLL